MMKGVARGTGAVGLSTARVFTRDGGKKPWGLLSCGLLLVAALASVPSPATAHAIAGQRLFPSTLSFDDPGIGAELPFVYSHTPTTGGSENGFDLSVTKPITPRFSLSVGTGYEIDPQDHGPSVHGWNNVSVGGAWQAFVVPQTESIGKLSFSDTVGQTGSRSTRDDFSTFSTEFDFGQGMGWLPWAALRPAAVTGAVGFDWPDDPAAPRLMEWDVSLQYSIPYLQDFVKNVGIPAPFNNMIALVEIPMASCVGHCGGTRTLGDIDPGAIWIGHYVQAGLELQLPVNSASGDGVGVLFGLDIYLDDVFPHGFGAPIFGL